MNDYSVMLIQGVIGLLSAVVAAYLSARWAVRGALREKWWERKFHAYSEILEALHHLVWYSETLREVYELMEHAPSSARQAERRERYLDAQLAIRKATDIGPFIITGDAAHILENLKEQTQSGDSEVPHEVILDAHCRNYRDALEGIRKCAKQDLGGMPIRAIHLLRCALRHSAS
jgi:hypothetical protein